MLSDKKLSKKSKTTKLIAKKLLEEKEVIKILQNLGEPIIIGSFSLNLMYDEDIDIVVKSDSPRETAIKALNTFIKKKLFQKYEFGDFFEYPREKRPNGYIVNLRINYGGKSWEIEIWFLEDIISYIDQLEDYKSRIDSENRLEILKLKNKRDMEGITKHGLSSVDIYNKVLNISNEKTKK